MNTYWVSKAAAGAGLKVALSGLGGDELFGESTLGVAKLHQQPPQQPRIAHDDGESSLQVDVGLPGR